MSSQEASRGEISPDSLRTESLTRASVPALTVLAAVPTVPTARVPSPTGGAPIDRAAMRVALSRNVAEAAAAATAARVKLAIAEAEAPASALLRYVVKVKL